MDIKFGFVVGKWNNKESVNRFSLLYHSEYFSTIIQAKIDCTDIGFRRVATLL